MTPFSELYSKYYTLTANILSLAYKEPIDLDTIRALITEKGFLESPTSLLPQLISQEEDGYHLLFKDGKTYRSILKNKPVSTFTTLEASWLRALLEDEKIHLFLNDEDYYIIKKALGSIEPLITSDMISFARQNQSCRGYYSKSYISCFQSLTSALQQEKLVCLKIHSETHPTDSHPLSATLSNPVSNDTYQNRQPQNISSTVAPYKLEYSIREDTFNLLAIDLVDNEPVGLRRIPLTSIDSLELLGEAPPRKCLNTFAKAYRCKEPIHFELNNMRSGFERAFMYLSPYERIAEFNEETQTCLVQLYYYPFDEEELIDMLISFGPIIKILSPTHIKERFKLRINQQFDLFANFFTR